MNAVPEFARHAWPVARLGEALEALARHLGLSPGSAGARLAVDHEHFTDEDLPRWLEALASASGVDAERVAMPRERLAEVLRAAGPALLRVTVAERSCLLVLLGTRGGRLRLLDAERCVRTIAPRALAEALNAATPAADEADIVALLARAGIQGRAALRARRALARTRLAEQRFDDAWLLRPPAVSPWAPRLREARLPALACALVAVFALLYAAEIAAWALIGRGALDGQFERGWLAAWTLLLASLVPLEMFGHALEARLTIGAGRAIKARVLDGALALPPDTVRTAGAGHLLARVLETQTFEALLQGGGFAALLALIELACAVWVLLQAPHGVAPVLALCAMLALFAALAWRYQAGLARWTRARFDLTHDLTERLTGHRTRQAQEPIARRHRDEDQLLDDYLDLTRGFDRAALPLLGALPRAWLAVGLVALAPALLAGDATPLGLGIALGGVLLAQRALLALVGGASSLLRAHLAWREVRGLLASDAEATHPAQPWRADETGAPGDTLLELRDVDYRYRADGAPALAGCDLVVKRGDRLLIEGPSGGGKSTLAALIAGWRRPSRGLMLLRGLDRATLGASWRRIATAAPQFHENHLLSGTLAFNLLMGREWPPSEADLAEAESVCHALGLDPLLERMPSGIMQMVGETGWQLSHGERSRVYLARALLQGADLVVLDESFAALDPPTLAACLRYAMDRAPTLAVIAHP